MSAQDIPNVFYVQHENYTDTRIRNKRFKHEDLIRIIEKLDSKVFSVKTAGYSIENREICLIKAGRGPLKILAWSQMHGDESTATMAMLDILNFLSRNDSLNYLRDSLLKNVTFYFVPMLNPDGAERFRRRNAAGIDLNRDAALLQCPESRILKSLRDEIQPEFAFNLHDQSPRYSAGNSYRSATISFLAPPFDFDRNINDIRLRAMQVIALMDGVLKQFIPGHTAKYSDEFEPRAFGDNMQRWGSSTILIESGGWPGDHEKQFVRKLNFVALLSAFKYIASGTYKGISTDKYFSIPDNEKYIYDLILRNVQYEFTPGNKFRLDVGINRYEEEAGGNRFYFRSMVEDTGDMSVFYGFEEIDCSGLEVKPGKVYPKVIDTFADLVSLDFEAILSGGFTSIMVKNLPQEIRYSAYPVNLINVKDGQNSAAYKSTDPFINAPADFVVSDKNGVRFAIVNGFIYDLHTSSNNVYNGMVYSPATEN